MKADMSDSPLYLYKDLLFDKYGHTFELETYRDLQNIQNQPMKTDIYQCILELFHMRMMELDRK